MGGDLRFGATLSVAGDGAIDDARVDLPHDLVTQPQTLHDAWPKLIDHHIRRLDQGRKLFQSTRRLQVDGNAALAAIEHRERDAGVAEPRLILTQLLSASDAFDLDHFCTRLGQHQRRHRAGEQRTEIEHANA